MCINSPLKFIYYRESDPAIASEVENWAEPLVNLSKEVVGHAAVFLDGNWQTCRLVECTMGINNFNLLNFFQHHKNI